MDLHEEIHHRISKQNTDHMLDIREVDVGAPEDTYSLN